MACIPAEGYAQAARMLSTGDITADLVRLSTALPIQIMVGQADVITPPESNLEIAAAIPAASVHVVPGAGHALYLEKPAEFNRLVSDFAAHVRRVENNKFSDRPALKGRLFSSRRALRRRSRTIVCV